MDREAIARSERRRQALEALELERAREAALRERLESVAAALDGAGVDEQAFARMPPEDAEVVRAAFAESEPEPDPDDPEGENARAERLAWLEEELVRLDAETGASARRQRAFERYLDALGP